MFTARCSANGSERKIKYLQSSMTEMPLPSESVDCLWVQESLVHCNDKEKAVKEFFRILKHGGKIVFEDITLLSSRFKKEVEAVFEKGGHIKNFLTPVQYKRIFVKEGFVLNKFKNLSKHLLFTYQYELIALREKKNTIRKKVPNELLDFFNSDFFRPQKIQLVKKKKFGCIAMVFDKP